MDLSGKVLLERKLIPSGSAFTEKLDLSDQPAGLYLLQVQSGSASRVLKVLKE